MSYLTPQNPKDPRRKPRRIGRREEEGGHARRNFSLCRAIREYLDKRSKSIENNSKYLERLVLLDMIISENTPAHILVYEDGSICAGLLGPDYVYKVLTKWQREALMNSMLTRARLDSHASL